MQYTKLKNVFPLEIEITSPVIDIYSLSIFHLNMQEIFDRVAIQSLYIKRYFPDRDWRYWESRYFEPLRYRSQSPLIHAEITSVRLGSWIEEITFAIPAILADPDMRAILQNLAANVIWAISESGVRGLNRRFAHRETEMRRTNDLFEIGPNLREAMRAVVENDGTATIKFRHRRADNEVMELSIQLDAEDSEEDK